MGEERRTLEEIRSGGTPRESEAVTALREEIQRLDPRAGVNIDHEADGIEVQRGEQYISLPLERLRAHLQGMSGEEAAELIERFARSAVADHFEEEDAGTLLPAVRHAEYLDAVRAEGLEPACRRLSTCGELYLCLVLDTPEMMRMFAEEELEEHGFEGLDAAEENAVETLDSHVRHSGELRLEQRTIDADTLSKAGLEAREVTMHLLGLDEALESYDSSLLLLRGLMEHLCADPESPFGELADAGDLAFALPTRDTLLLVDGREPHEMAALSLLARTVHADDPHPISTGVFRYASAPGEKLLLERADKLDG